MAEKKRSPRPRLEGDPSLLQLLPPLVGASKPARPVVTRSPTRMVGQVNCRWFQDEPVRHESRLEKHFIYRAILFGPLRRIRHQPFQMALSSGRYTPDFLLDFQGGERAVTEVKPASKVKANKSIFDEIANRLWQQRILYYVVHDGQIARHGASSRAGLLRRYATLLVPDSSRRNALEIAARSPKGIRVREILKQARLSTVQLYALIARHELRTSELLLLHDDALIFPSCRETTNAAAEFGNWFGCTPWRTDT